MNPLKLIFAGTPPFAAHILRALLRAQYPIAGVYTQPDRPAGRGQNLLPSAVKCLAQEFGLPVFEPATLRSEEATNTLAALSPELLIAVAYGLILPKPILETPTFGCLNVHASLLPRWRGAAPIQRAIAAGDTQTGITIMQMDAGLDTGDILLQAACPILPTDTAGTLHDKLAALGAATLLKALSGIQKYRAQKKPQDPGAATYAHKLTKAEAHIHWQQSATVIERAIRAYNPWPAAYTLLGELPLRIWRGEHVLVTPPSLTLSHKGGGDKKVLPSLPSPGTILSLHKQGIDVATGEGGLRILELQLPGKKVMPVETVLNGHAQLFRVGQVLG